MLKKCITILLSFVLLLSSVAAVFGQDAGDVASATGDVDGETDTATTGDIAGDDSAAGAEPPISTDELETERVESLDAIGASLSEDAALEIQAASEEAVSIQPRRGLGFGQRLRYWFTFNKAKKADLKLQFAEQRVAAAVDAAETGDGAAADELLADYETLAAESEELEAEATEGSDDVEDELAQQDEQRRHGLRIDILRQKVLSNERIPAEVREHLKARFDAILKKQEEQREKRRQKLERLMNAAEARGELTEEERARLEEKKEHADEVIAYRAARRELRDLKKELQQADKEKREELKEKFKRIREAAQEKDPELLQAAARRDVTKEEFERLRGELKKEREALRNDLKEARDAVKDEMKDRKLERKEERATEREERQAERADERAERDENRDSTDANANADANSRSDGSVSTVRSR